MGNHTSKTKESNLNTQPKMIGDEHDNSCTNSTKKRIAEGAFMATNPAGALIARAIRSSKSRKKNNTDYSTSDDEF